MKNFIKDFKEFAIRGNVIDLAIGVVVGGAFSGITTSLVQNIINPILGLFIGKIDFANLFIALSTRHFASIDEAKAAGVQVITYGVFLNTVINFVITAFAIFVLIRQINKLHKTKELPPSVKKCQFCFKEIPIEATKCAFCTSELK